MNKVSHFSFYVRPPGRVAQSVGRLTQEPEVPSSIPGPAVVSYWRRYMHEVLVNRLGGLSLPRKSVVRLTDRPDMTLDVYRGRKTTQQQQQNTLQVYEFLPLLTKWNSSCDFLSVFPG